MGQATGEIQRRSRAFPHCKYFLWSLCPHSIIIQLYVSSFPDLWPANKYDVGYERDRLFIGSKGMFVNTIKYDKIGIFKCVCTFIRNTIAPS